MRKLIFGLSVLLFSCGGEQVAKETKSDIAQLSEQLLKTPYDLHLIEARKQLFLDRGNVEAALIDQRQIVALDSTNHELLYELAHMQYKVAISGKPDYYRAALNSLSKELEAQEKHTESLLLRGELRYLYKKHKESLTDLNNVLRANPYEAKAYFHKGLNFKEMGDLEKATAQFQTAVEQDPNYKEAFEQLGFIYEFQGNPLAENYFNNALAVDSSDVQLWYNKGKYLQDLGRFEDAKKCYRSILRRDQFNQFAHYNLGYIYLKQQDFESGANHFSEVIYTNPNYTSAFFARGICFKEMGNLPQAKLDFQNTLKLDPDFREAQEELQKIK
jgi:tetratricopeptide (TPR) repeat protein